MPQLCGHAKCARPLQRGSVSPMTHTLKRTTHLPGDIADVFDFFGNPSNLETITPPWLGFRITSSSDAEVREGTLLQYRLSLYGIPLSWKSRIAEYEVNSHFADEQISGPYAHWYHRHTFRQLADGVEMTDEVDYRLPFGPLGRLVNWLIVRHQLRAIFDYRTQVIAKHFGDATPSQQGVSA